VNLRQAYIELLRPRLAVLNAMETKDAQAE
jgi:hypothetical protein